MKLLYVIPANRTEDGLKMSTFIRTEVAAVKSLIPDTEIYYFTERRSIKGFRKSLKALKAKIAEFHPDIIHVHYGSTTALLVAQASGTIPWVITFGGSDLLGHPNKGFYWRVRESFAVGLSKYAAGRANGIICVSRNLEEAVPEKDKRKVRLIPRGVNTLFFMPLDQEEERRKLGWDVEKRYILFSMPRANADVKNMPLAEKVIAQLNQKGPEEFVLVPLTGKTPEFVRSAMNASDLLLVTSLHEGSPNIVKESMACNLPVVSVNCGDVKERLRNVKNSYVSEAYDAEELSGLIRNVLASGERSNGRQALDSDGISVEIVSKKIVNAYQEITRKS